MADTKKTERKALITRRKALITRLKLIIAAHHYVFISKSLDDVAAAANISRKNLEKLMHTRKQEWELCLKFFHNNFPYNFPHTEKENESNSFVEKSWTKVVNFNKAFMSSETHTTGIASEPCDVDENVYVNFENTGDLKTARRVWTDMVSTEYHAYPYPLEFKHKKMLRDSQLPKQLDIDDLKFSRRVRRWIRRYLRRAFRFLYKCQDFLS